MLYNTTHAALLALSPELQYFVWALASVFFGLAAVLMWLGLYDEMYTHGFGAASRRLDKDLVIYLLNTPLCSWLAVRLSPFEGTATPFAVGTGICWILISADLGMSWHKHVHLTVICLALTLLLSPSDVTTTPFILTAFIGSIVAFVRGVTDLTVWAVCTGLALLLLVLGGTTIPFAVSAVIVSIVSFVLGIKDPDHAKMHFTASAVCLGLVALRVLFNTTAAIFFDSTLVCVRHASMRATADVLVLNVKS